MGVGPALACVLLGLLAACSGGSSGDSSSAAPATGFADPGDEPVVAGRPADDPSPDDGTASFLLTESEQETTGPGNWRRARSAPVPTDETLTDEQDRAILQLEALGYAGGSRAGDAAGVTIHREDEVYRGWNLYTSGHRPEAILMDMEGNEIHRWHRASLEVFPDLPPARARYMGAQWWCWMHLFDNGDILAIYNSTGLVKLNARSEVLWASLNRAHHDVAVADNGDIYVLTQKASVIPRIHETKPVLENFVTVMGPDGRTKKSASLLEAFEGTAFEDAWKSELEYGDLFHTNTLVLLDGRGSGRVPAFEQGNLLLCMAQPSLLAVLDLGRGKVVWAHKGQFQTPHDPQLLDDGNLLLFDNQGLPGESRALELDPVTGETRWEYRGSAQHPLLSERMGSVQRLPNGNTLITESEGGRVIEVTAQGEIVWEFHTPHRAGEEGEFIATIGRMRRLPPDYPIDWVPGR